MNRRILAAFAAAALLTACGGGGDDNGDGGDSAAGDNSEATSKISEQLVSETGLSEEDADCIAGAMVDDIGVEALQEGGLIDEELQLSGDGASASLSEDDADKAAHAFTDCVDTVEFATNALGEDVSPEVIECVETGFSEDDFHAAMKANFMGDTETASEYLQGVFTCMFEAE